MSESFPPDFTPDDTDAPEIPPGQTVEDQLEEMRREEAESPATPEFPDVS